MQVLDPDTHVRTRYGWPQKAAKPESHDKSPSVAETLLGEREEFRVVLRFPPFPQAAARLALFLRDVQVLLREDLHDLQEPLLACRAHAVTVEQHFILDMIASEVARLDEVLSQSMGMLEEQWQNTTNLTTRPGGISILHYDLSRCSENRCIQGEAFVSDCSASPKTQQRAATHHR